MRPTLFLHNEQLRIRIPRESTTPSRFPKQLDIHRQHRWEIQGSRHNLDRSQSGNGTHPFRMREGQVRLLLIDECMTDGDCPLHQSPANRRDPSGEYHDNLHLPCVSCRLHLSSRKQQRGGTDDAWETHSCRDTCTYNNPPINDLLH